MTTIEARAGVLAEAIETWSATTQGDEVCRRDTYRRLRGRAVHPDTVLLFSDAQYDGREASNARSPQRAHIPARFDDDTAVDWSPVWSLTRREHRDVLSTSCWYGWPTGARPTLPALPNGRAAGPTLADAVLAGMLELVERDSVALWWYNRLPRPAVDLDHFGDTAIRQLRRAHHDHGRDVWALDLTTDLGIAVCAAVSRRRDTTSSCSSGSAPPSTRRTRLAGR